MKKFYVEYWRKSEIEASSQEDAEKKADLYNARSDIRDVRVVVLEEKTS